MKNYMKLIIIIIIFSLLNCSKKSNNEKLITVSILPQKYFVEQIVSDKFSVNVMIPPGHNPATYEPTINQLTKILNSPIYFRIGYIPFEITNIDKIKSFNNNIKIVDTSKGIDLIKSHGHHGNAGTDPHIWLSPKCTVIICDNILKAMIQIDPDNKKFYESNHETLIKKIKQLDEEINYKLKKIKNRTFFTYHPIWSYFSRDYGFEQIPIEFEGKEPTISQIKKIIETSRTKNIKTIFIQKQFNKTGAETIAKDIKGKLIVLDPLREDWLNNMKEISKTLKRELDK